MAVLVYSYKQTFEFHTEEIKLMYLTSRGSTLVSTILRKSIRSVTINIFLIIIKKLFKLKSRDENFISRNPPICKASLKENGQHSVMTQKPRKGDFRELKSTKFQGGSCPSPPRSLCLHCSFRKLVGIYPRSVPAYGV